MMFIGFIGSCIFNNIIVPIQLNMIRYPELRKRDEADITRLLQSEILQSESERYRHASTCSVMFRRLRRDFFL